MGVNVSDRIFATSVEHPTVICANNIKKHEMKDILLTMLPLSLLGVFTVECSLGGDDWMAELIPTKNIAMIGKIVPKCIVLYDLRKDC